MGCSSVSVVANSLRLLRFRDTRYPALRPTGSDNGHDPAAMASSCYEELKRHISGHCPVLDLFRNPTPAKTSLAF